MPTIDNDKETEEEEMEHDGESDKTSNGEETGTASSDQEDDEESELEVDEAESERRRCECMEDMSILEGQFNELKESLYKEKLHQMEMKLEEVKEGRAEEYLNPLRQLEKNREIRLEVAEILHQYRIKATQEKFESEEIAAYQNMQSEKVILYDTLKHDLEEKIRRLEEDRHNIDISSDLWNENESLKKRKKSDSLSSSRRKKPVTVTGPYIVYMASEKDIIDDWTLIKKAVKQQQQMRRRADYR